MEDIFNLIAQATKPNPNAELIEKLDKQNMFLVRNDGVILTDKIGNYRTISPMYATDAIKELDELCNRLKASHTFTAVLVSEYKKQNPFFKF